MNVHCSMTFNKVMNELTYCHVCKGLFSNIFEYLLYHICFDRFSYMEGK